jgi:hypothetical protein
VEIRGRGTAIWVDSKMFKPLRRQGCRVSVMRDIHIGKDYFMHVRHRRMLSITFHQYHCSVCTDRYHSASKSIEHNNKMSIAQVDMECYIEVDDAESLDPGCPCRCTDAASSFPTALAGD